MGSYLAVFIIEIITALILWFILKRIFKQTRAYKIVLICLLISLIAGFTASYRMTGYSVTMDYLTEINEQTIETTGKSITLEEENKYKEELFQQPEFHMILIPNSIKLSLISFIAVLVIMIILGNKHGNKLNANSS